MTVRESSDSNESLPDPSDGAVAGSAADPPVNPDSHESEGTGADPTEETRSFGSSVRQALKWSFVNTGGAKIIGLMSGVILARLLTPHDYGLFAIAFLALNLANSLNDAGLQQAITRWPGDIDGVAP